MIMLLEIYFYFCNSFLFTSILKCDSRLQLVCRARFSFFAAMLSRVDGNAVLMHVEVAGLPLWTFTFAAVAASSGLIVVATGAICTYANTHTLFPRRETTKGTGTITKDRSVFIRSNRVQHVLDGVVAGHLFDFLREVQSIILTLL